MGHVDRSDSNFDHFTLTSCVCVRSKNCKVSSVSLQMRSVSSQRGLKNFLLFLLHTHGGPLLLSSGVFLPSRPRVFYRSTTTQIDRCSCYILSFILLESRETIKYYNYDRCLVNDPHNGLFFPSTKYRTSEYRIQYQMQVRVAQLETTTYSLYRMRVHWTCWQLFYEQEIPNGEKEL